MENSLFGMFNTREIDSKVKIGSGEHVKVEIIGYLRGISVKKWNQDSHHSERRKICTTNFLSVNRSN